MRHMPGLSLCKCAVPSPQGQIGFPDSSEGSVVQQTLPKGVKLHKQNQTQDVITKIFWKDVQHVMLFS